MTKGFSGLLALWALSGALSGCAAPADEADAIGRLEQALNVCSATIEPDLVVDGIPAYAQCTDSASAAIYSNNGIDTATSAASDDWERTQFSGGYQCTELLHRYWLFVWDVTWLPNGNAGTWCNSMPPEGSGMVQAATPVHGDAIVFAPGVCGADDETGHVALIDTVDIANSTVTFIEQNRAGRRTSNWSCAACFLHVEANDGSGSVSVMGPDVTATAGTADAGAAPPLVDPTTPPTGSPAPVMTEDVPEPPTTSAPSVPMTASPTPVATSVPPMSSTAPMVASSTPPSMPVTSPQGVETTSQGGAAGAPPSDGVPPPPGNPGATSVATEPALPSSSAAPGSVPAPSMTPAVSEFPVASQPSAPAGCHVLRERPSGHAMGFAWLGAALLALRRRRPKPSQVLISVPPKLSVSEAAIPPRPSATARHTAS